MKALPRAWLVTLLSTLAACGGSRGGPPALSIAGSLPAAGATGVPVDSPIVLTLNRALDPQTIGGALVVEAAASGLQPGHTGYDGAAQTLRFLPDDYLAAGDSYTVRIADTVRTTDGLPIASGLSIAFTTVAPSTPDWTPAVPIDGTTGAVRLVAHGDGSGVLCVFVQPDTLGQQLRWTRWTAAGGWAAPAPVPTAPLSTSMAALLLDGNDAGQCVLLADTTNGLRSVAFAPASGWSADQDASLVPASAPIRVDGTGAVRAAWIASQPPASSPLHLLMAVRPWNGDWQPPVPVQDYAPGEVPVLEAFDALPDGRLGCLVRRPAATGGATFESVDVDPATLATMMHGIDDRAFTSLASTSVGPDGHRVAILRDSTPGSPLLASWFTPGMGAGAAWSNAMPLGLYSTGHLGEFLRTFVLPDGTALVLHYEPGLFDLGSGMPPALTAVVRSPRSGWRPPLLLAESGLGGNGYPSPNAPLDAVVDDAGLQLVGNDGIGFYPVARHWLPSERTWSPELTLGPGALSPLQVVRSGDFAHVIWISQTLMAAHRR